MSEQGYLVLKRSTGDKVTITAPNGDVITLMIVEVRGNNTRIGISGPKTYKILREELVDEC